MLFNRLIISLAIILITFIFTGIIYSPKCFSTENFHPTTYTYVLQADRLNKKKSKAARIIRDSKRDLIIIDPFFTNDTRWSPEDLNIIRGDADNRKIVAYLSIGEAEDYRSYWQKKWSKKINRPAFIEEENPDWKGNFKVRYWNPVWKNIIFKELEHIKNAGFDGVFLDIIDGFEYFEDDPDLGYIDYKLNPETGNSYRADMIDLVGGIKDYLNTGEKKYLIIPQNGAQLLESPIYQDHISMLALESLFTSDNSAQPAKHTNYIMNFVTSVINHDKSILLTEYPTKKKYLKYSRDSASKYNITLLLTNRALSKLGKSYKGKQ